MEQMNQTEILFKQWQDGDPMALNLFFESCYETTFLPIARRLVRHERDRWFTDLDLARNAFLALQRAKIPFPNPNAAIAYATLAMKNDLRDHAKRKKSLSLDALLEEGGL